MNKNIGIVESYKSNLGIIKSNNESFIFNKNDLLDNIKVGDKVIFRKENINGINRAFFVKLFKND